MHHLTCGIPSLLHSVNLILSTLLLVRLILARITSSQSPLSLSPSIPPSAFYSRLNPFHKSQLQILSSIVFLVPFGLSSRISNLYRAK